MYTYHMFLSQNRPLRQRARNCKKQRELPHDCLIGLLSVQVDLVDGAVLSKRTGFRAAPVTQSARWFRELSSGSPSGVHVFYMLVVKQHCSSLRFQLQKSYRSMFGAEQHT